MTTKIVATVNFIVVDISLSFIVECFQTNAFCSNSLTTTKTDENAKMACDVKERETAFHRGVDN